jgi:hypothetical protein
MVPSSTRLRIDRISKICLGGHVDIEDERQFGFVPHGLVVTPSFLHLTGPKVTERPAASSL